MKRVAALGAALASLVALGCGAAPLAGPAQGGAPWSVLRTPHFVVRTDLEAEVARERIAEFEILYDALRTVMAPPAGAADGAIDVVLFARRDAFAELSGRGDVSGGYFTSQPDGDLEPRPTLVFPNTLVTSTQATFLHELTHRFLHQRFSAPPRWLDEGLADYFSTLRVLDWHIVLGSRVPRARFVRGGGWSEEYVIQERQVRIGDGSFFERDSERQGTYRQLQIPLDAAPSVAELFGLDTSAFYARSSDEAELHRGARNYCAAWELVRVLLNGPDERERARFAAYLEAASAGTDAATALRTSLGDDAATRLEPLYRAELDRQGAGTRSVAFPPRAAPPIEQAVMTDADVHLLFARNRPRRSSAAAWVDVALALSSAPRSAEAHFERAVLALNAGEPSDAERDLDVALAARPDEPRYLLGRLLAAERRSTGGGVTRDPGLVARLASTATTAAELNAVAIAVAERGDVAAATRFNERALRGDPLCWSCHFTQAVLLFAQKQLMPAREAVRRALVLLPEGQRDARYVALERRIVDAIAKTPPSAAP